MKFLKQKMDEWKIINRRYREKFKKENNPDIVIEFITKHRLAMDEPWVNKEIRYWYVEENYPALKKLKPGRGENEVNTKYQIAITDLWVVDSVEKMVKKGISKTKAFEELSSQKIAGEYYTEGMIKKKYYRGRKRKPEIFAKDLGSHYQMTVCPTLIRINEKETIIGEFTFEIPKN